MAGGPIMSRRGETHGGFRRRRWQPMSEINVTPFVDVMLVLLIVFMVTAPLLTVGVPIDLPKVSARQLNDPGEPLEITVTNGGQVYIQETEVDLEALVPRLTAITGEDFESRIHVRGDENVAYGQVMQVMGRINTAGFSSVSLIVEQPSRQE
ncbi:protein TolR [Fodinicurvata sediminis]|uniref:protein TolR n=1 Tax=Fodinicurvata sediminis TaxID=1121832 RepID=UPI0003B6CB3F|nr:protein TolR [Fodinicurvata sediminis]